MAKQIRSKLRKTGSFLRVGLLALILVAGMLLPNTIAIADGSPDLTAPVHEFAVVTGHTSAGNLYGGKTASPPAGVTDYTFTMQNGTHLFKAGDATEYHYSIPMFGDVLYVVVKAGSGPDTYYLYSISGGAGTGTLEWSHDDTDGYNVTVSKVGGYPSIRVERKPGYTGASGLSHFCVFFQKTTKGSIDIFKKDATNNAALGGAVFSLTQGDATLPATTEADGHIAVNNLTAGTWRVTEVTPPTGYDLSSPSYRDVTVTAGETTNVEFSNPRLTGSLTITKDIDNYTDLTTSFEFTVTAAGYSHAPFTLTDGQSITLSGLEWKDYTITETSSTGYTTSGFLKDGHLTAGNSITVTVGAQSTSVAVTAVNNRDMGSVKIIKHDQRGGVLGGAYFRLSMDPDFLTGVITTTEPSSDTDGTITVPGLASGTWYVQETIAPEGYVRDTSTQHANVTKGGTAEVTFVNIKNEGSIDIFKKDATNNTGLGGAVFSLTQGGTTLPATTEANGHIVVSNLKAGTWRVTEVTPPTGYNLSSPSYQNVTVTAGGTANVEFSNPRIPGSLTITKDIDNYTDTATTFTFTVTAPGYTHDPFTLTDGQSITLDGLAWKDYTITETASTGYTTSGFWKGGNFTAGNSTTVTVGAQSTTVAVTAVNNRDHGNMKITKIDSDTKLPIPGVKFAISTNWADFTGATEVTTGTDGTATIDLVTGTYYVKETFAPAGYDFDGTLVTTVNITKGGTAEVNRENTPHCWVKIIKTDSKNPTVPVVGAVFEVSRNADFSGSIELTTTADGTVTSDKLVPGHWYVREKSAPDGYRYDSTVQQADIVLHEVKEFTFTNIPTGDLVLLKEDINTHARLTGVRFNVYTDAAGTQLLVFKDEHGASQTAENLLVTDVNGFVIHDVDAGTYYVREVQAPAGYDIDNNLYSVAVARGVPGIFTSEDPPLRYTLTLHKIAENTGLPVEDAYFDLYNADKTEVVASGHTDAAGILEFPNLLAGTYYALETAAPTGYKLPAPNPYIQVSVSYDGLNSFTVTNARDDEEEYQTYDLTVKKVDGYSKNPLDKAVFALYSNAGCTVQVGTNQTTDSSGRATFTGLDKGNYWIKEITAPKGYKKIETAFAVYVGADVLITIENTIDDEKEYQTGTDDYNLLLGGGALLIAGGGILAYALARRKRAATHKG